MALDGAVRQGGSNVDTLCNAESILKFNAKDPNRAINLRVTERQSDRAEVACHSIMN